MEDYKICPICKKHCFNVKYREKIGVVCCRRCYNVKKTSWREELKSYHWGGNPNFLG